MFVPLVVWMYRHWVVRACPANTPVGISGRDRFHLSFKPSPGRVGCQMTCWQISVYIQALRRPEAVQKYGPLGWKLQKDQWRFSCARRMQSISQIQNIWGGNWQKTMHMMVAVFFCWYLCGKLGVVILHRIVDLIPAGDSEGGLCTPEWGPISILPFGYTPFIGWAIK